jgi:pimeloyl-ACP methyl ester carboxylesterase
MELFYKEYRGDGRDDPLIILHGLLGASGNWHTLSRTVFRNHARVFTVDQRNHGRSPHAPKFDYEAMAADVRDFIARHNLGSVTLMGHSMGGKTAMQTALAYPTLVDRLIVVDMAAKAYPPRHTDLLRALQRIDPSDYDDRSAIDAELEESIPSRPIRQFLLKNLQYDGERYTWQMNLDVIAANYSAINDAITSSSTFDGPTQFIRGGDSDYVDVEDMVQARTLFPDATLETVDGAGHWVHADAPEAFAETVVEFLEQHPEAAA